MTQQRETKLEYVLTHLHKADMIVYLKSHRDHFPELLKLALSHKPPYSWRAAWVLWSCMDKNDKRIRKHVKRIIDLLPVVQDNQQRELLLVLQRMELEADYEGQLFDVCTKIWGSVNKMPSVRFNAFKVMITMSKKYPELLSEIKSLTDSCFTDSLSPAVKKSVFKLLMKRSRYRSRKEM